MNLNMNLREIKLDKDLIIDAVIVIIGLIFLIKISSAQKIALNKLRLEKDSQVKKSELIGQISSLDKDILDYKKVFKKRDISGIVNSVGNLAKKSGINVTSLKPDYKGVDSEGYIKYSLDLSVKTAGYHELGNFISRLENSPDIDFVNKLSLKQSSPGGEAYQGNIFDAEIGCSIIELK